MFDKKKQLEMLMKKYVDKNNCIDIAKFRQDNPNDYALLSHYFGSVNQAIENNGWVKVQKTSSKTGKKVTLRNQLAYEAIKNMRKDSTLEQIATKYGVTRAAINQLFHALESTIEDEKYDEE